MVRQFKTRLAFSRKVSCKIDASPTIWAIPSNSGKLSLVIIDRKHIVRSYLRNKVVALGKTQWYRYNRCGRDNPEPSFSKRRRCRA
jgi:hypothetical protein